MTKMAPDRGHFFLWERPYRHDLKSAGLWEARDSRVARRSPRVKLPGYFHASDDIKRLRTVLTASNKIMGTKRAG